jgi:glucose-1-phosphate thymidylyltransferase
VKVVGVVPAAGRATRLQPLACSKEVLPVRGRPVMEYLVERLRAGGCDELRVVTRPEKLDVAALARSADATVVLGEPATVPASLALGIGGLSPDDIVLLGFPDTLWEPRDAFATLVGELGSCDVALGVFSSREPERADVVVLAEDGRVIDLRTKGVAPPENLVWGCLAARAAALAGVERHVEISDHLRPLAALGRIRGCVFASELVDIGTRDALAAMGATV